MKTTIEQQRKKPLVTSKRFTKNDNGFVCQNCGHIVPPLLSSSRDHCTNCLYSIHVDINPGDRANTCHGLLVPIGVTLNSKKGTIINYHCDTCGEYHNNKSAPDDNFDTIVELSRNPIKKLYKS